MTLTAIHFTFVTFLLALAVQTFWNCGFYAITREGKIMHFIYEILMKKKEKRYDCMPEGNQAYDEKLFRALYGDFEKLRTEGKTAVYNRIASEMKGLKIFSDQEPHEIAENISTREERRLVKEEDPPSKNRFYFKQSAFVFPAILRDPIVGCITCMGSFHSLVLYTSYSLFLGFSWNFFEWVLLAVSAAFTGEFLWKMNSKLN